MTSHDRCDDCAACRPPRRWTREQAIGWLVTMYWSDWELEEAMAAPDPFVFLRECAMDSERVFMGPHVPSYITTAGRVHFWEPLSRLEGEPLVQLRVEQLVRETLKRLDLVPRGHGLAQPRLL